MKLLPKITIITATKNSAPTLEKAFDSVIKQNYPNLEYIVLDAESTDGTVDIIKKYEKYLTYWHSKKDNGAHDAYAKAANLATGDLVAFLNGDDFYEDGVFEKVAEEFAKNPELDTISTRYRVIKNGKIIEETSCDDMELNKEKGINSFGINARFFTKKLLAKHGLPLVELRNEEDDKERTIRKVKNLVNDLEYMLRLAFSDVKNFTIDMMGYNYLSHDDSVTFGGNSVRQQSILEDKIFMAKKFLKEQNKLPLTPFWQKTLKKWVKKYRAKLVKSLISTGDTKLAITNFKYGIKDCGIGFVFYLLKTIIRNK